MHSNLNPGALSFYPQKQFELTQWHYFTYFFLNIFFLYKKSGGASWWRVCYQQGLPRLVLYVFKFSSLYIL